mmetsp:Transcript_3457/g.12130  ORF Transcript_3457/g.12130 Transcript_3457/m.12130 type:complete len:275 (+) Transcript_3457:206-1030(+)
MRRSARATARCASSGVDAKTPARSVAARRPARVRDAIDCVCEAGELAAGKAQRFGKVRAVRGRQEVRHGAGHGYDVPEHRHLHRPRRVAGRSGRRTELVRSLFDEGAKRQVEGLCQGRLEPAPGCEAPADGEQTAPFAEAHQLRQEAAPGADVSMADDGVLFVVRPVVVRLEQDGRRQREHPGARGRVVESDVVAEERLDDGVDADSARHAARGDDARVRQPHRRQLGDDAQPPRESKQRRRRVGRAVVGWGLGHVPTPRGSELPRRREDGGGA